MDFPNDVDIINIDGINDFVIDIVAGVPRRYFCKMLFNNFRLINFTPKIEKIEINEHVNFFAGWNIQRVIALVVESFVCFISYFLIL